MARLAEFFTVTAVLLFLGLFFVLIGFVNDLFFGEKASWELFLHRIDIVGGVAINWGIGILITTIYSIFILLPIQLRVDKNLIDSPWGVGVSMVIICLVTYFYSLPIVFGKPRTVLGVINSFHWIARGDYEIQATVAYMRVTAFLSQYGISTFKANILYVLGWLLTVEGCISLYERIRRIYSGKRIIAD